MKLSNQVMGSTAGVSSALAFAGMNLFVFIAAGRLDAAACLAARGLVGVVVLTPLVWRDVPAMFSWQGWALWVQCVFGALASFALFYNVHASGVGEAVALSYMAPVFVAMVAPFIFGEQLRASQAAGVLVMLAGAVCIQLVHAPWRISHATFIGLCGALSAAASLLALKRAAQEHSPWLACWAFCLFAMVTAAAVIRPDAIHKAYEDWKEVLVVGSLGTLGQICLSWSFKRLPASLAGALSLSTLIFSVLLESVYAARWPSRLQLAGYSLMCVGLLLLQRRSVTTEG